MSNSYNAKLDPTLPVSFFAAGFRFGHSLIPPTLEKWSISHQFVGTLFAAICIPPHFHL